MYELIDNAIQLVILMLIAAAFLIVVIFIVGLFSVIKKIWLILIHSENKTFAGDKNCDHKWICYGSNDEYLFIGCKKCNAQKTLKKEEFEKFLVTKKIFEEWEEKLE